MQVRRFSTVFALYLRPVAINPSAKHEEEEYATTSEAKALAAIWDPLGSSKETIIHDLCFQGVISQDTCNISLDVI